MLQKVNQFKRIISHAKEYGFVFPSSEIYDGLSAVYDYGQNGALLKNNIIPWKGYTDLYIKPGFKFKIVDILLTNFHLPKSTLLILISAFFGQKNVKSAYKYAIDNNYRFYSYGDCCLLPRKS